ncbi:MAG: hypothetical protein H7Y88_04930 [Phycisphaerales bacterium]|nr:hypothetical protein [Phycisphaerales bacterium]
MQRHGRSVTPIKPERFTVDQEGMVGFGLETLAAMAVIAAVAVLGMLYALASMVRDQTQVEALKARAEILRREYSKLRSDDEVLVVQEAVEEEMDTPDEVMHQKAA